MLRLLKPAKGVPKGALIRALPTKPIGATEPETGRPVLHASKDPEVNQDRATAEHDGVKRAIEDLVKGIPGAEMAGARAEKDEDRRDEKIEEEGQSPATVRDYSGLRIAVDSPEVAKQVAEALRKHFEVHAEQDEFEKGSEDFAFHAHTLNVRASGSPVTHEVQILPREVAEDANDEHGLYEKARAGDAKVAAQLKAHNEANYSAFKARQAGKAPDDKVPKHEKGSTQITIPAGSAAANKLDEFRKQIPAEHLSGQGSDPGVGGNHVTVRYGLDDDKHDEIKKYLGAQAPFQAELGETDVFPPTQYSDGMAVVHAKVKSPDIERMNAEIEKHGNFAASNFKDYKPHATIAYIKPEHAEVYKGRKDLTGAKFPVNSVAISHRDDTQEEVPLKGATAGRERNAAPAPPAKQKEGPGTPAWKKGDAMVVPDPRTGGVRAGTVEYWNPSQAGKPGGRVVLQDGARINQIPAKAQRVVTDGVKASPTEHTPGEKAAIDHAEKTLPHMAAQYLEQRTANGVPTIAVDAAKLLFPAYKADPAGKERDVHAAAKMVQDGVLKTALAAPVDPAKPDVLITTGSPGSGKTAMQIFGGERSRIGIQVEDIADDFAVFSSLIDAILKSGRRPVVEWVYVDKPQKTVDRMLKRALGDKTKEGDRPGIGRTVSTDYMARSYANLPSVLEQIRKKYGNQVTMHVIDNSGPMGSAKASGDVGRYLTRGRMQLKQVQEGMDEAMAQHERAGSFKGEHGQAVYRAATAKVRGSGDPKGVPSPGREGQSAPPIRARGGGQGRETGQPGAG